MSGPIGRPTMRMRAVRQQIAALDPSLALFNVSTVDDRITRSVVNERLIASLSATLSGMATLLAVIGLYGVLAYSVTRRTREIGIRMALGALGSQIASRVLLEAAALVGIGLLLGGGAAVWLGRFVENQLYGVKPADALTVAVAAASLAAGCRACRAAARSPRVDDFTDDGAPRPVARGLLTRSRPDRGPRKALHSLRQELLGPGPHVHHRSVRIGRTLAGIDEEHRRRRRPAAADCRNEVTPTASEVPTQISSWIRGAAAWTTCQSVLGMADIKLVEPQHMRPNEAAARGARRNGGDPRVPVELCEIDGVEGNGLERTETACRIGAAASVG